MTQEMREIYVAKITVNIGEGQVGESVETAVKLLESMTGSTAVRTQSGEEAKAFGLRDGLNIGAKTTLRGDDAVTFLEHAFEAVGNTVSAQAFDRQGNFSFGVEEYINMPNMKYNPDIGMKGFEIAVTLERPGYRVQKRKDPRPLGGEHRITPEDAKQFVQEQFNVEIVD